MTSQIALRTNDSTNNNNNTHKMDISLDWSWMENMGVEIKIATTKKENVPLASPRKKAPWRQMLPKEEKNFTKHLVETFEARFIILLFCLSLSTTNFPTLPHLPFAFFQINWHCWAQAPLKNTKM